MDHAEAWPTGATPCPRSGVVAKRSYPTPEVRGGSQEELPHVQGAAAVWASVINVIMFKLKQNNMEQVW